MNAIRRALVIALAGLAAVASADAASARILHRHRVAHYGVRHFVFATPAAAGAAAGPGAFGGAFETGILGASTADPYETPAVGYDGHGYYGPGFAYPGY